MERRPRSRCCERLRLDRAAVEIGEIGPFRGFVAGREQVALPGLLLVPDDTQLPDAVGAAMGSGEGEGAKLRRGGIVLGVDGFPELVLVAPGTDQQEIEIAAAAVQHRKAETAGEL